jgi:hypothetical protein
MAHSICGYTFSFLQIPGRWYHRIGGPLFLVLLGILWLTNLIVSPSCRTLMRPPLTVRARAELSVRGS